MGERRVMEARESNEHIDLMRLIVMQLISAPAPVMKMKGLQQSEINWDLLPPTLLFFCLSPVSLDTYQKGLADRGSAPFPVCVSPPVSLHPFPQRCYHCGFRNFHTRRAAFSAGFRWAVWRKGAGASLFTITMHHDSRSSFSQLQAGRLSCQVTFRCINTRTGKKEISREIKFADVWKRCFCGAFD